ncbi:type II toxin-antitoxin system RelE/ParE family toxin [Rhizobium esperanzae]|uniref:Toxin ParE1/3/4 n=1 Tax=Rhizobium esperanzae TaxID=1967781 RepID=A0A7W6R2T9_9HYPH|nr:type II toxin-antitoxin system RelE/ParE family toxin [Rhizobium esperanzae]MBB4235656.1 toxin ParE1/3/4 [Rhizobium esperanzae]
MVHRTVFHRRAEAELDELYELLLTRAGPVIAGAYVQGLYDFIDDLAAFPERGTVREGSVPGLRIIGYRRRVTIAFVVQGNDVVILGVFYGGRNVTVEMLEERL